MESNLEENAEPSNVLVEELDDDIVVEENYPESDSDNDSDTELVNDLLPTDLPSTQQRRQVSRDGDLKVEVIEARLHGGAPSFSLSLHPKDDTLVASGGGDNQTLLLRVDDAKITVLASLKGSSDTIEHVKFNRNGKLLATGSLDGGVRVYETEKLINCLERVVEDALFVLEGPECAVSWISWYPKIDHILVCGFEDGSVWIFDCTSTCEELNQCGTVIAVLVAGSSCSTASFTEDGSKLVVASGNCVINIWDTSTLTEGFFKNSTPTLKYNLATNDDENSLSSTYPVCIATNPDGMTAAVALSNGIVHMVHLRIQKLITTISYDSSIECVGYDRSMNPPLLLIGGLECGLRIVSLLSTLISAQAVDGGVFSERGSLTPKGGVTAWSTYGQGQLVLGGLTGRVTLVDTRQTRVIHTILFDNIMRDSDLDEKFEEDLSNNAIYAIAQIGSNRVIGAFDDGYLRVIPI